MNHLVALYCSEKEINSELLRKWLENYVPQYMIPRRFIWTSEFKYTIGGKVDRKAMSGVMKNKEEKM